MRRYRKPLNIITLKNYYDMLKKHHSKQKMKTAIINGVKCYMIEVVNAKS